MQYRALLPCPTRALAALVSLGAWLGLPASAQAWEPSQPIELVVPAGTGGGADQMARFIQEVATRHKLLKQPIKVVNKAGNSGAEGMLDVKADAGNPHKLLITLSSLFTTPMSTGIAFNWRDITPVSMLALDQFVLWVNADSPYQSAPALLDALKKMPPNNFKLGGTGSKQEDQLISVLLETAANTRIQYVPLKGGGDVAKALAAGDVDMTVNNPIEAEALWRSGKLRPLCVFDSAALTYTAKLSHGRAWSEIPTCYSSGIPAQYLMLRGIFTTAKTSPEQQAFYVQFFDRVRALPEWKEFMVKGAFRQTAMSGAAYTTWIERAESYHRVLMRESKLMAK